MTRSSLVRCVLAGALAWNSTPHAVIAATGRRGLTPFGRDSSPAANLVWSLLNAGAAVALVRSADARTGGGEGWLLPFEAGGLAWALFGVVYEQRRR